ncbi:Protein OS-9 [Irineochytrium annulatum]|nr:Protein OS-9 [Irineochytrium annulatum]
MKLPALLLLLTSTTIVASRGQISRRIVYADVFASPKTRLQFGTDSVDAGAVVTDDNTFVMKSGRRRFLCTADLDNADEEDFVDRATADVKISAVDKALSLVGAMEGQCITYTQGYWTYEFCHLGKINQWADIPAKDKKSKPRRINYLLGVFSPSLPEGFYGDAETAGPGGAELIEGEEDGRKYLRMFYGNGQLCDGRPRVVEVQFSCCVNEHIANVDEIAVCNYVMQVHTPKVCQDEVFRATPKPTASPAAGGGASTKGSIVCRTILDGDGGDAVVKELKEGDEDTARYFSVADMRRLGCSDGTGCKNAGPIAEMAAKTSGSVSSQMMELDGGAQALLAGAAAAGTLPWQATDGIAAEELLEDLVLDILDGMAMDEEDGVRYDDDDADEYVYEDFDLEDYDDGTRLRESLEAVLMDVRVELAGMDAGGEEERSMLLARALEDAVQRKKEKDTEKERVEQKAT